MDKQIVLPGEVVTEERKKLGSHVFLREGKICSDCVGLAKVDEAYASVVPLHGGYQARENDVVIGIVQGEKFAGFDVDINHIYPAFVHRKSLRVDIRSKDVISAKVVSVNEFNEVELDFVRVLRGGQVLKVEPVKTPRIIGRNNSMADVLKAGTGANLVVGRNGRVWAEGGDLPLLQRALQKIQDEAHTENLTESMNAFLQAEKGKGRD